MSRMLAHHASARDQEETDAILIRIGRAVVRWVGHRPGRFDLHSNGHLLRSVLLQLFDAREQAIDGAKAEAKRMQEEAVQKREHFEAELRRVSASANEEREKGRTEAQRLARQLTEQARSQALTTQKAAKDRLDVQAAEVRKNALAQVPVIARELTSKLLGRSVQP
jgi:F-type H+-transporting ATPase subunit b